MLYVCLITAPGHTVESVRTFDVPSDGQACDQAMAIARGYSTSHGYDVWREGRKIAAYFPKTAPARTTRGTAPLRVVIGARAKTR